MAWSSGVFSRIHSWVNDRDAAIKILATRHDAEDDNLASGINNTLTKDGQNTPTANLPMGNFRHTGVGNAAARNDYASAAQIQDGGLVYFVDSGAADAYVITPSPAISAYTAGNLFWFKATNANTGASTININAVGAKSIFKQNDVELDANDIVASGIYGVIYESVADAFQLVSSVSATTVNLNHLSGFTLSNGTDADHDIDLAVGEAADSTNDQLMKTGSVIVKQIDANWVAGSAVGGFPSGLTLTADTWYHFFVIKDVTGGTVDAGFDSSLTATNLLTDATAYTLFRRVGSVLTDGASNILAFRQLGDTFIWDVPINEFNGTPVTTRTNVTMTSPLGIKIPVRFSASISTSGTGVSKQILYNDPDDTDTAPSTQLHDIIATDGIGAFDGSATTFIEVVTNTSSQVAHHSSAASGTENMITKGYIDTRGK